LEVVELYEMESGAQAQYRWQQMELTAPVAE
jgi:hypothetical protein